MAGICLKTQAPKILTILQNNPHQLPYEKMSIQVYGIPNCGTCKKAVKWLQDNNIEYEFINTKEQLPSREMIQNWVETLGSKPMRNTSGSKDVMLLKRPLFVKNSEAVLVGFRASEDVLREKLAI